MHVRLKLNVTQPTTLHVVNLITGREINRLVDDADRLNDRKQRLMLDIASIDRQLNFLGRWFAYPSCSFSPNRFNWIANKCVNGGWWVLPWRPLPGLCKWPSKCQLKWLWPRVQLKNELNLKQYTFLTSHRTWISRWVIHCCHISNSKMRLNFEKKSPRPTNFLLKIGTRIPESMRPFISVTRGNGMQMRERSNGTVR